MEDFIRMNMGAVLGVASWLVILIVIYAITMKKISRDMQSGAMFGFWLLILATAIICIVIATNQASVNNVPRKVIDRSYTKETQKNYENRVTADDSTKNK